MTCPNGQYAETMAEIRAKVKLSEVGIQGGITTRFAATGALVIEVPRSENGPKADALVSRMREVLKDKEGVRINHPTKIADKSQRTRMFHHKRGSNRSRNRERSMSIP